MADLRGANCTVYYVDGAAGNNSNAGTATGTAWATIQYALDKIADGTVNDGDEVRIMATGSYTISSTLDPAFDRKEVTITGANAIGNVDGTQAVLIGAVGGSSAMLEFEASEGERLVFAHLHFDANDNSQNCILSAGDNHYMKFVNCRFSQATSDGVVWSGNNYWDFLYCRFDNCAGSGLKMDGLAFCVGYRCLFDNNGAHGCDSATLNGYRHKWMECVFYNNTTDGMEWVGAGGFVANCVFDSNGQHGLTDRASTIQSLRLNNIYTNNGSAGVNTRGTTDSVAFNEIFHGNDNDIEDTGGGSQAISELAHFINYIPSANERQNPQYADAANFDFTPTNVEFSGFKSGIPTPFKWFGATASDMGLGKYKSSESVSVF